MILQSDFRSLKNSVVANVMERKRIFAFSIYIRYKSLFNSNCALIHAIAVSVFQDTLSLNQNYHSISSRDAFITLVKTVDLLGTF